jgi:hypothetical protein
MGFTRHIVAEGPLVAIGIAHNPELCDYLPFLEISPGLSRWHPVENVGAL